MFVVIAIIYFVFVLLPIVVVVVVGFSFFLSFPVRSFVFEANFPNLIDYSTF